MQSSIKPQMNPLPGLGEGWVREFAMGKGFFTDTTVCIGCKACQVACHQWNQLPTESDYELLGTSYDNTGNLSAENWRHVKFIEQFPESPSDRAPGRWLMMSDVCKHCTD